MNLSQLQSRLYRFFRTNDHLILSCFFVIILGVLFINAFHESYPDEFDNILGGWYIIHGIPIYTGFFTHHGPVAYFLSALITLIGGNSFVAFRVIFALFIFVFLLWSYIYVRGRFGRERSFFYLIFIAITSLAGNYYWLHMLLADTLSAYFLAPVVTILLLTTYYKMTLRTRDLVVISVLTSLTVLSSLTFLFFSFLIYGYSFYLFLRTNKSSPLSRSSGKGIFIFAAPFILFGFYLLATMSFREYLFQAWTFNQSYYVYNYPRPEGVTTINPLRFAIVIANNVYNSYFTLLQQVHTLNFGFPLNITLATGTLGLIIFLLMKREYLFSLVFTGFLIYSNSRSDPLNSKETDYQSAVYIMLALVVIPFLLTKLYSEFKKHEEYGKKVISIALFLLIGTYGLFSTLFLFQKFFNRTYEKYMGTAALIYDRPEIAPIINNLVDVNEPVWVGPFEFKELFYIHGRPASRYHIFLPGMGASPIVRERMIQEFEQTKPKVIYFQRNFSILGRNPDMYGQFFIDYLRHRYITLQEYTRDGKTYRSSVPVTEKIDLEGRLYIRKENADEIVQKLLRNSYIHETTD